MRKTAILLAAALLAGVAFSADGQPASPKDAKPAKPVAAAGVVTDNKPDFAMVWVDGEEGPTKFSFAAGFDQSTFGFPPKNKGVFMPDRVQFTYTKGEEGKRQLLTMQRDKTPLQGTVTGEVQFSNDFWVAVKPKNGPMDGYAINWPPAEIGAKLKALQKGDWVTIKFHTDVERHRMDSLTVLPRPAVKPPPKPTTAPAAAPATSQPA